MCIHTHKPFRITILQYYRARTRITLGKVIWWAPVFSQVGGPNPSSGLPGLRPDPRRGLPPLWCLACQSQTAGSISSRPCARRVMLCTLFRRGPRHPSDPRSALSGDAQSLLAYTLGRRRAAGCGSDRKAQSPHGAGRGPYPEVFVGILRGDIPSCGSHRYTCRRRGPSTSVLASGNAGEHTFLR